MRVEILGERRDKINEGADTDKMREVIIKRHNTLPFYSDILKMNKEKRGEETALDPILPPDDTGIEAHGIMSFTTPLFALENIPKISKNLKDSYLSIYRIFS